MSYKVLKTIKAGNIWIHFTMLSMTKFSILRGKEKTDWLLQCSLLFLPPQLQCDFLKNKGKETKKKASMIVTVFWELGNKVVKHL